ncbi:hypothetical protein PTKIN_Ptkin02bG0244800 [Pterospermum kingtungense]
MQLFSKLLTPTDCSKRLAIPKGVLTSLPDFDGGHAVELQVRCESTREWPVVCTIRKKGYKKPVFSKGWRKFVLGNSLNVGDELIFHKEEDESGSVHYRVEVKKATRPSAMDHDLDDEAASTTRSCKNVGVLKRVPEGSCSYQTSAGSTVDDTASVRGTHGKEQEREFKLFGTMIGGAVVVGTTETNDLEAYHNSLKQLGLSADGDELVTCTDQASLIRSDGAKKGIPVVEHFNLGLTEGAGAVVHVHGQSTSSTSFYRTDQRLGFELGMMLGQSIEKKGVVNLDLNLGPPVEICH